MHIVKACFKIFIGLFIFIFSTPYVVNAAEVLQITNSSTLRIGDNNRDYKVKICCINIDPSKEKEAEFWLKKKLPRHSKVNLFPKDYEDGLLISEVVKLKTGENIASSMLELGFDKSNYLP